MFYTLVTGASSGIGRDICQRLDCLGNNIILMGSSLTKLEETRASCVNGENHQIFCYDLSDIDKLDFSFSNFIKSKAIHVDNFVHCAGRFLIEPVKDIDLNDLKLCFNVNLFSAIVLCQSLLRFSNNRKNLKNVVFVSSISSKGGAKGVSAYSSSKAGLDGFMRSFAIEMAPYVRINSVLPGAIPTKMTEFLFSDSESTKKISAAYPLGLGKVSDIADAVLWLLSGSSRWMTGQELIIDGGRIVNLSV